MTEPSETKSRVAEMIAEVNRGTSPALLTDFLRKTFPRRGPRWLTPLLGPLPDKSYAVRGIVLFDDGGFFVRSCVFETTAPAGLLEGHRLPSGGSLGLFALSPEGLSYLMRRREAVEELLRQEAHSLNECDAFALARFFAETLERKGNSGEDVVRSPDEVAGYNFSGGPKGFGGDYQLDAAEWQRIRERVRAPSIAGTRQLGWHLEYCGLFGWMHLKNALSLHSVDVGPDFRIRSETTVLSSRIFCKMPQVLY